jgi:hypothetical protein
MQTPGCLSRAFGTISGGGFLSPPDFFVSATLAGFRY